MGHEVQNYGDGGKQIPQDSGISFGDVWSAVEKTTGIQSVRALFRTETVENAMDDFKLLDDGRGAFNDAARKSVEDHLNGEQLQRLNDERGDYNKKLALAAIPSIFAPDLPEKGPQMQKFDKKVDEMVAAAEKTVKQGMSGDELKKLDAEVAKYKREQIASGIFRGIIPRASAPEKGPMMVEYEKRVLKEIKNGFVNWE